MDVKEYGSTIANVWLPNTLTETAKVLEKYIDTKEIDYTMIYPSFPTGGIIINKDDIHTIYETGKGKVILRGRVEIKDNKILITELPYQVYAQPYVEKITDMAIKDELTGISAVYNKSGKNKLLIEVECENSPNSVLQQLYAKTDLQKNYNANQWALVGKTPKLLTLKDYCEIYVKHNTECICREAQFDLEKAGDRVHILNGLLKALEDIDNIITLIKKSESGAAAKEKLIRKYQFSEAQAKAILAMRLSSLASLEKIELQNEKAELDKKMDELNALLANEDLQKTEIKNRLNALVKKYGDKRKTELTQIDIKPEEKEIETVTPVDCVVLMTKTGNIKRIAKSTFKIQKRNGKGVKNPDDTLLGAISTNTIDNLMLFTNKGKMYKLLVDNIPEGTNTSKGMHINNLLNLEPQEEIIAINSFERGSSAKYVIFITKNGQFKKTSIEEYKSVKKTTGIIAIKLNEGDTIANVVFANEEEFIIVTEEGMSIRFETKDIAPIGRNAAGVRSIKLREKDKILTGFPIGAETKYIAIITENGLGKRVLLDDFPTQGRAGKGVYVCKDIKVKGAEPVDEKTDLLIVGKPNNICISAKDLPILSRIGIGNIVIKDSKIQRVVRI